MNTPRDTLPQMKCKCRKFAPAECDPMKPTSASSRIPKTATAAARPADLAASVLCSPPRLPRNAARTHALRGSSSSSSPHTHSHTHPHTDVPALLPPAARRHRAPRHRRPRVLPHAGRLRRYMPPLRRLRRRARVPPPAPVPLLWRGRRVRVQRGRESRAGRRRSKYSTAPDV